MQGFESFFSYPRMNLGVGRALLKIDLENLKKSSNNGLIKTSETSFNKFQTRGWKIFKSFRGYSCQNCKFFAVSGRWRSRTFPLCTRRNGFKVTLNKLCGAPRNSSQLCLIIFDIFAKQIDTIQIILNEAFTHFGFFCQNYFLQSGTKSL